MLKETISGVWAHAGNTEVIKEKLLFLFNNGSRNANGEEWPFINGQQPTSQPCLGYHNRKNRTFITTIVKIFKEELNMYKPFIKRILDFFAALLGLALTLPILLVLMILLAIANKGNPFFFQKRPGKDEKIFSIVKFKTMNDNRDANGQLLPDADRLTKIGQLVRKTSLDELPQLINVLKGDMSLIGPRPLLISYLPLYNKEQKKRHRIRPGITGWAQVNGRNAIAWKQKFEYDVWYVEYCSFALDIKILGMTLSKVLKRDGISSDTSATMEAFTGN